MEAIKQAFADSKGQSRSALLAYVTAGYPTIQETPDIMLAMQAGGVDIINLGIPSTEAMADSEIMRRCNAKALQDGVRLPLILEMVKSARSKGLAVPVCLMGYCKPIFNYPLGEDQLLRDCKAAGVDGLIIVDYPPMYASLFSNTCRDKGLSYIPVVAPSTLPDPMEDLCASSDSFVYVMSRMAVVGPWQQIGDGIIQLIGRVDCVTEGTVPAVIAFGISTRAQFWRIAKHAEGVAIGNPIIEALENAEPGTGAQKVKRLCLYIAARLEWHVEIPERPQLPNEASDAPVALDVLADQPAASAASTTRPAAFDDLSAPTYLKSCLSELETAFAAASADPDFWDEIRSHAINANRPTSLEVAERLTAHAGGARIWLKREDLSHTGSHKINNALGQIILARRLGKAAIIAETATGAHGIATATLCAIFNMRCSIFMGSRDFETQPGKVSRMRLLGATVIPVQGVSGRCDGSGTVRDALNVAFRIWVVEQETTHLVLGSVFGPDPFPTIVRSFQMVIGTETRAQFQAVNGDGKLPDALVACVGGGSNATGMFYPFVQDLGVALVGVKAGRSGPMAGNSAVLTRGLDGVLRGVNTHVLPGEVRYASRTYSVSAGLDYPGVGTELMSWKESGRATFTAANDTEALGAFCLLSRMEGIMPALETAHAIAGALRVAKDIGAGGDVVVCLSGRGDDDVQTVADILPTLGENV